MLIELDRASAPELLMQGETHGIYWRLVAATNRQAVQQSYDAVVTHLWFLIDPSTIGMLYPFINISGVPPRYNVTAVGKPGVGLVLRRTYRGGLPAHYKLQWVEAYYGFLKISPKTGKYLGANMFSAWYPREQTTRHVDVLSRTFRKYIRPTAAYMCNYLQLASDTPISPSATSRTVVTYDN